MVTLSSEDEAEDEAEDKAEDKAEDDIWIQKREVVEEEEEEEDERDEKGKEGVAQEQAFGNKKKDKF